MLFHFFLFNDLNVDLVQNTNLQLDYNPKIWYLLHRFFHIHQQFGPFYYVGSSNGKGSNTETTNKDYSSDHILSFLSISFAYFSDLISTNSNHLSIHLCSAEFFSSINITTSIAFLFPKANTSSTWFISPWYNRHL